MEPIKKNSNGKFNIDVFWLALKIELSYKTVLASLLSLMIHTPLPNAFSSSNNKIPLEMW